MPEQEPKIKVAHTETFLIQINGQEIQVTRKDLEHLRVQINSAIGIERDYCRDIEEIFRRNRGRTREIEDTEIRPIRPAWPDWPKPAWPIDPMKPYCHTERIVRTQTETSDTKIQ